MARLTAASTVLSWLTDGGDSETMCPIDAAANTGGGLVYPGEFLGENGSTGLHRTFQSGDTFVGVALRAGDNSGNGSPLGFAGGNIGDGTAGSIEVATKSKGYFAWRGAITGLTGQLADQNTKVYCTDGSTLTTASGGGAAQVGVIIRWDTANNCWIIRLLNGVERNA